MSFALWWIARQVRVKRRLPANMSQWMRTLRKCLWHGARKASTPSLKTGCGLLHTSKARSLIGPRPSCNDSSGRQLRLPV